MAKDAWDANRAQKARKALDARQADFARQAQAALKTIEAKQAKAAAPRPDGKMQVQSLGPAALKAAVFPETAAPKAAPLAKSLPKGKVLAPKRGLMDRIKKTMPLDRIPVKTKPSPRVWGGGQDPDKEDVELPKWKVEGENPVAPEEKIAPEEDLEPKGEPPKDELKRKDPTPTHPEIAPKPRVETPVEPPTATPHKPTAPRTVEDPVAEPWMRDTGESEKEPEGQEDGKEGGKSGGSTGKSSSGGEKVYLEFGLFIKTLWSSL